MLSTILLKLLLFVSQTVNQEYMYFHLFNSIYAIKPLYIYIRLKIKPNSVRIRF